MNPWVLQASRNLEFIYFVCQIGSDLVVRKRVMLSVRDYYENIKVPLRAACIQHFIPANRFHIVSNETALEWPNFKQISDSLVGLQIGYICPNDRVMAHTPRKSGWDGAFLERLTQENYPWRIPIQ